MVPRFRDTFRSLGPNARGESRTGATFALLYKTRCSASGNQVWIVVNRWRTMTDLVPNVNGPKLSPFNGNLQDLIFIRQLSSDEDYTPDRIPHSRVFEVKFSLERKAKKYALKIVGVRN